MEKSRKRDFQAGLMLTLEVGMVHDIARLTKLVKTHGLKVEELSEQIQCTFNAGTLSAEEAGKKERQFIKRIQDLNNIIRDIHEMTKKMGQV